MEIGECRKSCMIQTVQESTESQSTYNRKIVRAEGGNMEHVLIDFNKLKVLHTFWQN